MKLTPFAKKMLGKRINKLVEVSFNNGGLIFGDGYCGRLLEFNEDSMTFRGLGGIVVINLRNVAQINYIGEDMYG